MVYAASLDESQVHDQVELDTMPRPTDGVRLREDMERQMAGLREELARLKR